MRAEWTGATRVSELGDTCPAMCVIAGSRIQGISGTLFLQFQTTEAPSHRATGASFPFQDPRLEEMLFRYRARSYPETLDDDERVRWETYRWERLNDPAVAGFTLRDFAREIERVNQVALSDRDRQILEELVMYVEAMMPAQAFD